MDERGRGTELSESQVEDIRLAASKMSGAKRRSFQAEMTLKYCEGSARQSEEVFKWSRRTAQLGLAEKRTGLTCVGAQAGWSGRKRWEEKQPEAAEALRELAESHSQQDPTFKSSVAYTRLTAAGALKGLKELGFADEQLPGVSTMAAILNRMGYRLRKVLKAKPEKKSLKPMQSSRISSKKTEEDKEVESSACLKTRKPK